MANILIVEDDIDIALGLGEYLEARGHVLDFAYNGKQALNILDGNHYDLILLDLSLPYVDGLDVCRMLLTEHLTHVPVIIMSARSEEQDVLKGFSAGAWDYLIKPFSFAELSARLTANLAKTKGAQAASLGTDFGRASLIPSTMTFHFGDQSLQLHQSGFQILKILMGQAPQVVQTSIIHQQLWGEEMPESDPLRAHIYKLRKQLEQTFGQQFIVTVKGVGYKFEVINKHCEMD